MRRSLRPPSTAAPITTYLRRARHKGLAPCEIKLSQAHGCLLGAVSGGGARALVQSAGAARAAGRFAAEPPPCLAQAD